jgi:hypothetical protein
MNAVRKASLEYIRRRSRPSVLVVSNCQTFGLASAMQRATDRFRIVGTPVNEIRDRTQKDHVETLAAFEHAFVLPELAHLRDIPELAGKVTVIPAILFDGYHPDCIYACRGDQLIDSPLGGYHSCIILAAFLDGYAPDDVAGLFNAALYREAGYFRQWQSSKAALFARFRSTGFAAEDHFYRWCAHGAFMHTINHPKIRVLADLAADMLRRLDCAAEETSDALTDNLGNSEIFPVYPEIAALTGARGSYRFKPAGTGETLSLREFIELSFQYYAGLPREELAAHQIHRSRFETVSALIRRDGGRA